MARNETKYNKPVGIKDGSVYVVDYTFEDTMHGEPFVGVTGTVLSPVSQAYIDERNEPENIEENYRDCWVEAVKSNNTDEGLTDWVRSNVIDDCHDGDFPGHDTSGLYDIEEYIPDLLQHFEDAVTFECIGGGRCFSKNMEFDVVLDQALVDEINRLEKEDERKSLSSNP